MPSCVTCGEEEFECTNGLYFCVVCQTQSQDFYLEVIDDATAHKAQGHGHAVKKTRTRSETGKKTPKGRPWSTYEAWGVIIKKMTSAMIRLGADPKLDRIMLRIWAKYLSYRGIAFREHTREDPNKGELKRQRDEYPGDIDNPAVENIRLRRTLYKKHGIVTKKMKTMNLQEEMEREEINQEEFYDGDHPLEEDRKRKEKEAGEFEQLYEKDSQDDDTNVLGKKVAPRWKQKRSAEYLTIRKVLAMCYLGLLHTNPLTMPDDVIRWLKSGDIPFFNISSELPEDMKFCSVDHNVFCQTFIPTSDQLLKLTGQWFSYLELDVPPRIDLMQVVCIYVTKLGLPAELLDIIKSLIKLKEPDLWKYILTASKTGREYSIPAYSLVAIAYIVIAVKLCFGLDDETEISLSKYATLINKCVSGLEKSQVFVWQDWVNSRVSSKLITESIEAEGDVGKMLDDMEKMLGEGARYSNYREHRMGTRTEYVEGRQRSMKLLNTKYQNRESNITATQDDDLLLLSENRDDEPDLVYSQDFCRQSIMYITNSSTFFNGIKTDRDADDLTPSSPPRDLDDSFDWVNAQTLPVQPEFETETQIVVTDHENWGKVCTYRDTLRPACARYVVYPNKIDKNTVFHKSYDWLLEECSTLIGFPKQSVHSTVHEVEILTVLKDVTLEKLGMSTVAKIYIFCRYGIADRVGKTKVTKTYSKKRKREDVL